ncbi:MAG: class I SAM-dependent methyltransferase [Nannocystaceae bacterium]|nr:class I SAM-dependent methyltransferase [Nannocystaceae bacterium]
MAVEQHYETLLAEVYDWMQGGWMPRVEAMRTLFAEHEVRGPGTAVDLGAGTGYQSIPLAEAGFDVVAVDVSDSMLRTLQEKAGGLSIRTQRGDLRTFDSFLQKPPELIVCMGDTLSHLPSRDDATQLVRTAAANLSQGGRLVLQFRTLSNLPAGDGRFLPIRSDEDRIFTCFLEEVSEEYVRVHDVLHTRDGTGFTQRVSSYTKTRLDRGWLDAALAAAGLQTAALQEQRGLITCVASKAVGRA